MLLVRDYLDDRRIDRNDDAARKPLVSVILPTFSRYRNGLLKRSVESVLTQTFDDFELIVMDDGSRDGTCDYIAQCRERDSRVVHVRHDENSGGLPALRVNEGIELARGRYVAFQFDDDAWCPEALELLTRTAADREDAAVIVGIARLHYGDTILHLPNKELNLTNLFLRNLIANNSVLVPRRLFDSFGMYDCHLGMRRLCDYDLWLRLVRYVPFLPIGEPVADCYGAQEGSLESTVPNDLDLFRFIHDVPRNHLLTPERWHDYEVDAIEIGPVALRGERRRRFHEEQLVPYYRKVRHRFPLVDCLPARWSDHPLKNAIVAGTENRPDYQGLFQGYDHLASRRGTYKVHHHHPRHLTADGIRADADALLLAGVLEPRDVEIAEVARLEGRPVAYLLDEAIIPGPATSGPSPGTGREADGYRYLAGVLTDADAVWVTDEGLARAARSYNRRTVPHAACLPPRWLPERPARREPGRPLIIGYTGGRPAEEIGFLANALTEVADEFGAAIRLVAWGDWPDAPPWSGVAVESAPEPSGYFERLARLRDSGFDILLAPRPVAPRRRDRPAVEPYHEAAVAGAVGLFSDVAAYAALPGDETCLKAANTAAAWTEALRRAITMPAVERERMRAAGLTHVRETATVAARIDGYEAAWGATEFHRLTRHQRGRDGRPRVAYVFHSPHVAGEEIQLWRRLKLMPAYGVEPLAILPAWARYDEVTHAVREELAALGAGLEFAEYMVFTELVTPRQYDNRAELEAMTVLLRDWGPALVHSTTFIPAVGRACRELCIPHVASLDAVDDRLTPDPAGYRRHCDLLQSDSLWYARRWGKLLGADHFCARNLVPERFFELGRRRMATDGAAGAPPDRPLRVVALGSFQPRKGQLAAVAAVGALRRERIPVKLEVYGDSHFAPDYFRACRERVAEDQAEAVVRFREFDPDVAAMLEEADILLCSSSYESFPTSISEAMAAGVLVVSTPAGGIPELIVDGVSGVLCGGFGDEEILEGLRRAVRMTATERSRMTAEARRVALTEFHPRRTANDLFAAYGQATRVRLVGAVAKRRRLERVASPSGGAAPVAATAPPPRTAWRRRPVGPLYWARRLARNFDARVLRLLNVTLPIETTSGQPVTGPAACPLKGPHRLVHAYCGLRRSVRTIDNTFARLAQRS
jgi:O-antigen biosynthesis protein